MRNFQFKPLASGKFQPGDVIRVVGETSLEWLKPIPLVVLGYYWPGNPRVLGLNGEDPTTDDQWINLLNRRQEGQSMSELLQVGDYVRWDKPNAGSYWKTHGDRLMEVVNADNEFVGVVYDDTRLPILGGELNFYHRRFKKENRFLILAHKAIKTEGETCKKQP